MGKKVGIFLHNYSGYQSNNQVDILHPEFFGHTRDYMNSNTNAVPLVAKGWPTFTSFT